MLCDALTSHGPFCRLLRLHPRAHLPTCSRPPWLNHHLDRPVVRPLVDCSLPCRVRSPLLLRLLHLACSPRLRPRALLPIGLALPTARIALHVNALGIVSQAPAPIALCNILSAHALR